jgi:hypothetical protein
MIVETDDKPRQPSIDPARSLQPGKPINGVKHLNREETAEPRP